MLIAILFMGAAIDPLVNLVHTNNESYSGFVIESKENYFIFQSGIERFYVYEKDNDREIGDYLVINSYPQDIKMTSYEGYFSFSEYLSQKGVTKSLSSYAIEEKFSTPFRLKAHREKFLSHFDDDSRVLIDAFLFNNKNYDNKTIAIASEMNLIFLMSMSGIYLSFLIKGMQKLLRLFMKENIADIIPYGFFLPYLVFCFP